MLSLWALMHGTAMLLIRGGVTEPLRTQMFYSCFDGLESIVQHAARTRTKKFSGPKWPSGLVLGEEAQSQVNGESYSPREPVAKEQGPRPGTR